MELTVFVQPTPGDGFRASSGEPLPASAEGATRDEALGKLRAVLEQRLRAGGEVVRLRLGPGGHMTAVPPVWPDDEITHNWLEGIAEARRAADQAPEPWAASPGAAGP